MPSARVSSNDLNTLAKLLRQLIRIALAQERSAHAKAQAPVKKPAKGMVVKPKPPEALARERERKWEREAYGDR